jgi:hypothetical protein
LQEDVVMAALARYTMPKQRSRDAEIAAFVDPSLVDRFA